MSQTADYLSTCDCQVHNFSSCVFKKQGVESWESRELPPSLDEKLKFIEKNMQTGIETAKIRGVRILAFTEHAQFMQQGVPFQSYLQLKEKIIREHRNSFEKLLFGFELDIRQDLKGAIQLNIDQLNDGHMSAMEMLPHAEVILIAPHAKDLTGFIQTSDHYANVLIQGMENSANQLRQRGYPADRQIILAHPWDAAGRMNQRAFMDSAGSQTKKRSPFTSGEFYGFLRDGAPIKFFQQDHLNALNNAFAKHNVIPEINYASIRRHASDIRADLQAPERQTIAEAYIKYCRNIGVAPRISVGSDAHVPERVGKNALITAEKQIPNLRYAALWP